MILINGIAFLILSFNYIFLRKIKDNILFKYCQKTYFIIGVVSIINFIIYKIFNLFDVIVVINTIFTIICLSLILKKIIAYNKSIEVLDELLKR